MHHFKISESPFPKDLKFEGGVHCVENRECVVNLKNCNFKYPFLWSQAHAINL